MIKRFKKILRQIYRKLKNRDIQIKKTISCMTKWYGTYYGGFYVAPEYLNEKSIVYSFGIGEDISFDLEVINRHNSKVIGFDPTPKSINWIKKQKLPPNFKMYEYGIGERTGVISFYLPKNKDYVSGSIIQNKFVNSKNRIEVLVKSFEEILAELKHEKIDLLKMDIEGAEYSVLPRIMNSNIEITQILIEFHHQMVKNGKNLTLKAINLLYQNGYEIFAVSDSAEISFIKSAIVKKHSGIN